MRPGVDLGWRVAVRGGARAQEGSSGTPSGEANWEGRSWTPAGQGARPWGETRGGRTRRWSGTREQGAAGGGGGRAARLTWAGVAQRAVGGGGAQRQSVPPARTSEHGARTSPHRQRCAPRGAAAAVLQLELHSLRVRPTFLPLRAPPWPGQCGRASAASYGSPASCPGPRQGWPQVRRWAARPGPGTVSAGGWARDPGLRRWHRAP